VDNKSDWRTSYKETDTKTGKQNYDIIHKSVNFFRGTNWVSQASLAFFWFSLCKKNCHFLWKLDFFSSLQIYSMVWIYHILLIHSSLGGHLGCFHFLVIVINDAVDMSIQISLPVPTFNSFLTFIYLWYWGFELKALGLPSKHPTTWATPLPLFALINFQIGSCVFAQASSGWWSSYLCLLSSWDYKCESQHPAPALNFFWSRPR
jgi:hypothetical protein